MLGQALWVIGCGVPESWGRHPNLQHRVWRTESGSCPEVLWCPWASFAELPRAYPQLCPLLPGLAAGGCVRRSLSVTLFSWGLQALPV